MKTLRTLQNPNESRFPTPQRACSATAPYNCPKSAAILNQGVDAILASGETGGYMFSTMTLMAANDPLNAILAANGQNVSALGLIPTATQSGGSLTLTFNMLNAAARGTATLNLEHSSYLGIGDPWTSVAVPDTTPGGPTRGVTFTVTPGSPTNAVTATISSSEAASGKLFGRLKAQP